MKFGDGRRVLLIALLALHGSTQHLVAGAAHQHRLHLIVREDRPAERRRARQHRQVAVRVEGARCRMSALCPRRGRSPPSTSWRPACSSACRGACRTGRCGRRRWRWHAHHEALQDADARMGIENAHEEEDRRAPSHCRHRAAACSHSPRPQRAQKSRTLPALKPSLRCGGDNGCGGRRRSPASGHLGFLCGGDLGPGGVAQEEIVELPAEGDSRTRSAFTARSRRTARPDPHCEVS